MASPGRENAHYRLTVEMKQHIARVERESPYRHCYSDSLRKAMLRQIRWEGLVAVFSVLLWQRRALSRWHPVHMKWSFPGRDYSCCLVQRKCNGQASSKVLASLVLSMCDSWVMESSSTLGTTKVVVSKTVSAGLTVKLRSWHACNLTSSKAWQCKSGVVRPQVQKSWR